MREGGEGGDDRNGARRTSADVPEALHAVHTRRLQPAVAQHLDDLRIFLSLLLEHEFSLLVVGLVLPPAPVLTTLFFLSR